MPGLGYYVPFPEEEDKDRSGLIRRGLASGFTQLVGDFGSILHFLGAEQAGSTIENWADDEMRHYLPPQDIQGSIIDKPDLLKSPDWWIYNTFQMLPSLFATWGTTGGMKIAGGAAIKAGKLGLGKALLKGAVPAGLTVGSSLEGAGVYREAREKGLSNPRLRGFLGGAGTAVTEYFPLSHVFGPLGKYGIPGKMLAGGLMEGFQEWSEEPIQALALGKDPVEAIKQGANVFPVSALVGALGAGSFGSHQRALQLNPTVPKVNQYTPQAAFEFYSPNTQSLEYDEARANLNTYNHQMYKRIAQDINDSLGLKAEIVDAVGDTVDWGAENSLVERIANPPDIETMRYAAAMKGLIGNQEAVLMFAPGEGKDMLYSMVIPDEEHNVRTVLRKYHFNEATLVPTAEGMGVFLYDPNGKKIKMAGRIGDFYNVKIDAYRGKGEFIGGESRQKARKNNLKIIKRFEDTHNIRYRPQGGLSTRWAEVSGQQGIFDRLNFKIPQVRAAAEESTQRLMSLFDDGRGYLQWYDFEKERLGRLFGEDTDTFIGFLAATSQHAALKGNTTFALKAYQQWKQGKPFEGYLPDVKKNLERVVKGEPLKGAKVSSFYRALMGDPGAVVIDLWMKRAFGLQDINEDKPLSDKQYEILADKIRKLAKEAGVAPRQFQAAVWTQFKKENQINNGELDPYHSLVGKALRTGKWRDLARQINALRSEAPPITFAPEEMVPMTKTSRSKGKKAPVPKTVTKIAKPTDKILDFGAGKDAAHARRMQDMGLDVTAYEDPAYGNFNDKLHDLHALSRQYDIVYASNVMNVQPSLQAFRKTLAQIVNATRPDGTVILNYTATPRHTKMPNGKTMTTAQARAEIEKVFGKVEQVAGTKNSPVWQASEPHPENIPAQVYLFARHEQRGPPRAIFKGDDIYTTYGTSILRGTKSTQEFVTTYSRIDAMNEIADQFKAHKMPEELQKMLKAGMDFFVETGNTGLMTSVLELAAGPAGYRSNIGERVDEIINRSYERRAMTQKPGLMITDLVIPAGERRKAVTSQLLRATLRAAYEKGIRDVGVRLPEDLNSVSHGQLLDVMQNLTVEGALSGAAMARSRRDSGPDYTVGRIWKKPALTPPEATPIEISEQIDDFIRRFDNKKKFHKPIDINVKPDAALDKWDRFFDFPEMSGLDTTIQAPHVEEAKALSVILEAVNQLGVPKSVFNQVHNIGVMFSQDGTTEGMYVPGSRTIVMKKAVASALTKAGDEVAVQQGLETVLTHELGHGLDIAPNNTSATSGSPDFVIRPEELEFVPANKPDPQSAAAEGKFILPEGNRDTGPVISEVLEFYNSPTAKKYSFSEFLLYPLARLEGMLRWQDNTIVVLPDGREATVREVLRENMVPEFAARTEKQLDWIKAELFAQLHAIYWNYPDLMKQELPGTYEKFRSIEYAIKDSPNPWTTYNAVRDVLSSNSPRFTAADFPRETVQEAAAGPAQGPASKGMGGPSVYASQRGSVPGDGGGGETTARAGVSGEESVQNVEDVFSKILEAIRTPSRYASTEKLREVVGELPVLLNRLGEQQFPELIDAARGGRQTIQDIAAMGEQLGVDPDWIRKNILERKVGTTLGAPGIHAAMEFLANESAAFGDALETYIEKLEAGTVSNADRAEFTKSLLYHALVQAQVSGLRSEAGRALGILAHYEKTAKVWDNAALEKVISLAGGEMNVDVVATMLQNLQKHGNTGAVNKFAREAFTPTTTDKLFEVWVNSLLSGPQTHVVNMTSNALVALNDDIVRMVAAGIGKLHGGEKVTFREAMARILATPAAFQHAAKALYKAVTDPDFADALTKIEYRHKTSIGGKLGQIIRTPGRLLTAEDAAFKTFTRVKEMHAQAMRRALQTGERPQKIIDKFLGNAEIPAGEKAFYQQMREEVDRVANVATFTNRPGDITRAMIQVLNRHPSMKFIVPFINTPMNIVKYAAKHSPLGLAFSDVKADLKAGGIARDVAIARMTWGSAVMGSIALLALQGLITGGGPDDPRERQLLYAQGWQPYSIKVGDQYYSFGRLEPLGMLFGIAADTVEIGERLSYGQTEDLAAMTFGAIAKNITSKTWLRGVSELINVMSDPDRYGRSYVQRLIGTLIPTGVAQVAGVTDPYLRRADDLMSSLKRRIPVKSRDVLPRLDLWGNRIRKEGGLGPDILSPVYLSSRVDDLVSAELMHIGRKTGYFPSRISRKVRGVELSPELHNELIVMARKPAHAMLNVMMRSPAWQAMSPELKEAIVRKVINRASLEARKALILKHPDYFIEQLKRSAG